MKSLLVIFIFAGAVVALSQTTTSITPTPIPPPPDILTSQAAAAVALTNYKAWVETSLQSHDTSIQTVWANQQTDEANIKTLQSKISSTVSPAPQGISGTGYTLATSLGNPYTWSLGASLLELRGSRRIVNFTNVRQFRLCANLANGAGAGSYIELDQSTDNSTWTILLSNIDFSTSTLSCTPWTTYSGPASDAFVRLLGTSPNAASAGVWYIGFEVQP